MFRRVGLSDGPTVRNDGHASRRQVATDREEMSELQYRVEFERQQFALYDARRVATETHANAIVAAALAVAAFVLSDYTRKGHPDLGWFLGAVGGLLWVLSLAFVARSVSWITPILSGKRKTPRPSQFVADSLDAFRTLPVDSHVDPFRLRQLALEHWHWRAISAYRLGRRKDLWLRVSFVGFLGPVAYVIVRAVS